MLRSCNGVPYLERCACTAPVPKRWYASELQAYNSSGRKTNQNTRQAASPALPSVGSKSVRSPNESLLGLKTLVVGMRNEAISPSGYSNLVETHSSDLTLT